MANENTSQESLGKSLMHIGFMLVIIFGFLLIGQLIGLLAPALLLGGSAEENLKQFQDIVSNGLPSDGSMEGIDSSALRTSILLFQFLAALVGMVGGGLVYWRIFEKKTHSLSGNSAKIDAKLLGLCAAIYLISAPLLFAIVQWNSQIDLSFMGQGFEEYAKAQEKQLANLTAFMLNFDSFGQFLLGLLTIGGLAALGEELIFRRLLQTKLLSIVKNPHVAILLSSALFSAIHFQFYGFIPRMLLGMLFGYYYYWGKNINYAILGHFLNNGVQVIVFYYLKMDFEKLGAEQANTQMPIVGVIISALLTGAALYGFHKFSKTNNKSAESPIS